VVELGIAGVGAAVVPGPPLAKIATAVLVLGLLNAVNLLDGQDGLAAGVGAVIGLAFACLGGAATPVGLGLAGALLGFLVLNRPPARIYLGDAGAYFVGTTVALLPALTDAADTRWSIWWAVPLLVAVPVADTAIAILRRLRARRPLLSGDRSHVYDQFVDRGLSIGRSTAVCVAAQVVLGGIGLLASRAAPAAALAITVGTAAVVAITVVRAGLLTTSPDSGADGST
jgi:UDP-GlcNAc:undecaprenyl-phosphate GlcNAc-1-phosphate transferase